MKERQLEPWSFLNKLFVNFFHPHHARTFDARQQLCGCDDPSNAGVRWRCVCSDASECENSSSSAVAYCLTCARPSFNNYNRIHPTSNIELSRMCLLSSGWLGPRTLRARSARGCNRLTCNRLGDEYYSSDRRNLFPCVSRLPRPVPVPAHPLRSFSFLFFFSCHNPLPLSAYRITDGTRLSIHGCVRVWPYTPAVPVSARISS